MNRREVLAAGATLMAAATITPPAGAAAAAEALITRKIPSSGEELPLIGIGTSGPFEVDASEAKHAPLREVLTAFFAAGRASSIPRPCIRARRQSSGAC